MYKRWWLTITVLLCLVIDPHSAYTQAGLDVEYFNDIELKNSALKKVESRPYLNFYKNPPAHGVNVEFFSARWTGILTPPLTGDYVILVRVDDGIRLWIDDKIIIDSWRDQEATTHDGSVFLEEKRPYKLKIEYYNSILHSVLMLSWETPEDGISFLGYSFFRTLKEIPASAFSVDRPKVAAVENSTSKEIVKPVTPKPAVVKASPKKKINSADTKTALHNDSLNNTPPIQLALNKVIKFESVRFVLSKAELLKGSYEELDMLALYLKNNLDLKVKIIGHTDYEGNWTANYTLSKQRATVVADYLKQHGVSAHRVSVEAMGPSKPVVIDDKPENREENRRVEFILSSL